MLIYTLNALKKIFSKCVELLPKTHFEIVLKVLPQNPFMLPNQERKLYINPCTPIDWGNIYMFLFCVPYFILNFSESRI